MKKIIICFMVALLALMCCACRKDTNSGAATEPPEAVQTEAPEETLEPTAEPTAEPTPEPTAEPTAEPTSEPTPEPTPEPTTEPTAEPTPSLSPLQRWTGAKGWVKTDGTNVRASGNTDAEVLITLKKGTPIRLLNTLESEWVEVLFQKTENGEWFDGFIKNDFVADENHEHTYENKVIEPTVNLQGYTLHTCSICGTSYKDNYFAVSTQSPTTQYPDSGEGSVAGVGSIIAPAIDEALADEVAGN